MNLRVNRVGAAVFIASPEPFLLKTDDNPTGVDGSVSERAGNVTGTDFVIDGGLVKTL